MRTLVAVLACALAGLAPAAGQAPGPPAADCGASEVCRYRLMLDAYAAADRERSVAALLAWDRDTAERAARLAGVTPASGVPDDRWHGLAAMLHTDAALAILSTDRARSDFHLDTAAKALERGSLRQSGVYRPLARRWYVALARCLGERGAPLVAERLLSRARDLLRADPVILAESGRLAELLATFYALSFDPSIVRRLETPHLASGIDGLRMERNGNLSRAAGFLRLAVALAPGDEMSHVRLGRVLALRFEDDAAARMLRSVAADAKDADAAYLAALFLGGLHERRLRLEDAAAAYRQAIARHPGGHAAHIGLSEVLRRLGRGDQSRQVLQDLLSKSPGPSDEPFSRYGFGAVGDADERLAALRQEVRR